MEDQYYFELTEQQKAAFKKLKAAYNACLKAGIYFVDNYGTLEAYNHKEVEGYANDDTYDRNDEDVLSSKDSYCANSMRIPNEWTDDEHLIKLTPLGVKKLNARRVNEDIS